MLAENRPRSANRRALWLLLWTLTVAVAGGCSKPASAQLADARATVERLKAAFATYRALDDQVLALAVENTNLKAQRLSFGAVREEADAVVAALDQAARAVPAIAAAT